MGSDFLLSRALESYVGNKGREEEKSTNTAKPKNFEGVVNLGLKCTVCDPVGQERKQDPPQDGRSRSKMTDSQSRIMVKTKERRTLPQLLDSAATSARAYGCWRAAPGMVHIGNHERLSSLRKP